MAKKKEEITIRSSTAEYLTYIASVGDVETSFEMRYEDENIWLTQKLTAVLYDVDVRTVNYHIKKIFADSELQEDSVIRKFRITAADGKSYSTNHYSLEMIIAVGFKVNSERAVQFRKWVKQLNRMVTAYLDFAENMTLRHIPLTMQDWEKRLNSFIEMFDYGILQDAGKVTAEIAKLHAETEFEKYRIIQDRLFMSDFDKYMLELEENTKK
mgnify:CR=1 FL=1